MPAEWYYYQNETRVGPVESEQIQQLLSTGQLRANDLVWRNGMAGWSPILSVPELAPTVPLQRYGDPPLHPQGHTAAPASATPAYAEPAYAPSGRRRLLPALGIGKILLLVGAGLWFINFFLPWWGLRVTAPTTQELANRRRDVDPILERNAEWYVRRLGPETLGKIYDVYNPNTPDVRYSSTLMGWSTGAGLMGFIFSFAIIAPIIVGIFVIPFRGWVWIASFVAALFGLVLLIFAMLWLFGSPGGSVPGLFWQGVIVGPWICLLGALLVLAGGILDGIFGVLRLARGSRPAYAPEPY